MKEKHILGLDLGTNSIGWAVVTADEDGKHLASAGSRIIPMDSEMLSNFGVGQSTSETHNRTISRAARRLNDRHKQRRERLNRVLDILGYLPPHYKKALNPYGQIMAGQEPKFGWYYVEGAAHFVFEDAYKEMLADISKKAPHLLENGKLIPYDWTIYYLRAKALHRPVSGMELAYVLHQFNSKRGCNLTRSDQEQNDDQEQTEQKRWLCLLVEKVEKKEEKKRGKDCYVLHLENGMEYEVASAEPINWEGERHDFVVTTYPNKKGKYSISAPNADSWDLLKAKTEEDIRNSGLTVGEYIYNNLISNPDKKILGQLVRTIDRSFYRKELNAIVEQQMQHLPELQDEQLLQKAILALYPSNETHRRTIASLGWKHLLVEDVILYQRPLKSKKHLVATCPFEERVYKESGTIKHVPLHVIPKSHPLFEEFRIWGYIHNLRIHEKQTYKDLTAEYLGTPEQRAALFDKLYSVKEIKQDSLLNALDKKLKDFAAWNYADDFVMECAPTCSELRTRLKAANASHLKISGKRWADIFISDEQETLVALWHLCYSIQNKTEFEKALRTLAGTNALDEELFVSSMLKVKPYSSLYGSLSERAISRLLPLMREGKYWSLARIDPQGVVCDKAGKSLHPTSDRINKLITGEYDENISDRVREKVMALQTPEQFQGLPEWLAEYVVYNRFSEAKMITKWSNPEEINDYLAAFRQHSLNNPVVEKVVLETMRVVRDLWKKYGTIDEIHIEMAREMKKNAKARKRESQINKQNEISRQRIRDILTEMLNESAIEGVRPYSASQQEKLRIIEDDVLRSGQLVDEDVAEALSIWNKRKKPSEKQIQKYWLWLEQHYVSPYTGKPISFSKLFTDAYQIEHVIPQAIYFDDSLNNKVVCEAEVNADKDRMFGMEYIERCSKHGRYTVKGTKIEILNVEAYKKLMNDLYGKNARKLQNMLCTDVPERFTNRQMADTRYISKLVMLILSNIVREEDAKTHAITELEARSKNVIVTNGSITSRLKQDWGINDVWNRIIMPRFERMNDLTRSDEYTTITNNGHLIPSLPLQDAGLDKKRIDHRHHAMDAIVIACTTQNHVNLLNNITGSDNRGASRYDLQKLLRNQEPWKNGESEGVRFTTFKKPWEHITEDTYKLLSSIVASTKCNLRVVKRRKNSQQVKGVNWGICRSLHQATGYGQVTLMEKRIKTMNLHSALSCITDVVESDLKKKLQELVNQGLNEKQIADYFTKEHDTWADVDLKKIKVFYIDKQIKAATRYGNELTQLFNKVVDDYEKCSPTDTNKQETIRQKTFDIINSITDSGIRKILLRHLQHLDGDVAQAFSPSGLELMNKHIAELNNGKLHKPIYKVRVSQDLGEKFMISAVNRKFVETDKGTNLYCGVFASAKGVRTFDILNLREVIRLQQAAYAQHVSWVDLYKEEKRRIDNNMDFLFMLSPGDPVEVTIEENGSTKKLYYRVNNFTGSDFYFRPINHAAAIHEKEVDLRFKDMSHTGTKGSFADKTTTINDTPIKNICVPITVSRLGEILQP